MRALIEQTDQLKENVSKTARKAEERLTHFGNEAVRMKATIAEAIEDRMNTARRAAKRGYRATEDFVDDTKHRIKRDPLRALGLSFVAGVAAGLALPAPHARMTNPRSRPRTAEDGPRRCNRSEFAGGPPVGTFGLRVSVLPPALWTPWPRDWLTHEC